MSGKQKQRQALHATGNDVLHILMAFFTLMHKRPCSRVRAHLSSHEARNNRRGETVGSLGITEQSSAGKLRDLLCTRGDALSAAEASL
eukprot:5675333-Amphidinium_carterae.1